MKVTDIWIKAYIDISTMSRQLYETYFTKRASKIIVCTLLLPAFILMRNAVFAQRDSVNSADKSIAIIVRPSLDSITLRWAPIEANTWLLGSRVGYSIERFTLVRNGAVLNQPERTLLTPSPIKPFNEDAWEKLVVSNRYAAIAAQTLMGDKFELELTQADIITIVNKVQENEQRHSVALFCADMSPAVARALGLWFTDHNVKKEEKYLYRIYIPATEIDEGESALRGSVFSSPNDDYEVTQPLGLQIEVEENIASLKWEKNDRQFTAYIVERSEDGESYQALSDIPLVTLSPSRNEQSRFAYQSDSISVPGKTYYYQVKGVTPFGEVSKASELVRGKVNQKPGGNLHIIEAESSDNTTTRITWDFPLSHNDLIRGFSIEHSNSPKGNFTDLSPNLLPPQARMYVDTKASQVNYYKVVAVSHQGVRIESPLFFTQLIDSIAPLSPGGLTANIDEFGKVDLRWESNTESDIFGYRVYRGNTISEELAQLTSEPIAALSYSEKVSTGTLNESVVYGVIAVDKNQNQSPMSVLLKVDLPDKLPPMAPVMLPVENNTNGVKISWVRSSSTDVIQYDVYRGMPGSSEWIRIKIAKATNDLTYSYFDESSHVGSQWQYTVVAIDESGLESPPTSAVAGNKLDTALRESVLWKNHQIMKEEGKVLLQWAYAGKDAISFKLYKAIGDAPLVLYKTIQSDINEFSDSINPGKRYTYRMQIVFAKNKHSKLSEEISVNF